MKINIATKRETEQAFKLLCKSMPEGSYCNLQLEIIRYASNDEIEVKYSAYCGGNKVRLVNSDTPMKAVNRLIERNEDDTAT